MRQCPGGLYHSLRSISQTSCELLQYHSFSLQMERIIGVRVSYIHAWNHMLEMHHLKETLTLNTITDSCPLCLTAWSFTQEKFYRLYKIFDNNKNIFEAVARSVIIQSTGNTQQQEFSLCRNRAHCASQSELLMAFRVFLLSNFLASACIWDVMR